MWSTLLCEPSTPGPVSRLVWNERGLGFEPPLPLTNCVISSEIPRHLSTPSPHQQDGGKAKLQQWLHERVSRTFGTPRLAQGKSPVGNVQRCGQEQTLKPEGQGLSLSWPVDINPGIFRANPVLLLRMTYDGISTDNPRYVSMWTHTTQAGRSQEHLWKPATFRRGENALQSKHCPCMGEGVTRSPISTMSWSPQRLSVPNAQPWHTKVGHLLLEKGKKKKKIKPFSKKSGLFYHLEQKSHCKQLAPGVAGVGLQCTSDTQHQHQGKLPPARSKGAFTCEVLLALMPCRESISLVVTKCYYQC